MRKIFFGLFLISIFALSAYAQNSTLEGYIFEDGNRGYLNGVEVKIMESTNNQLVATTTTNKDGLFTASVPAGKTYTVQAEKDLFDLQKTTVVVKSSDQRKKVYTKIKMVRKPGYLFDVTLAEMLSAGKEEVDAITGAKIEVFNNTTGQTVLDYPNHPNPTFKVNFERGNHYTILIRKVGYFAKQLEAYVDVKGCILCFEGIGNVQPGVSDVLTQGNKIGTLLANISMRPMILNQINRLQNDYFNLENGFSETEKQELDGLLEMVKSNPELTFELAAHTDARGDDFYNQQLSQRIADNIAQHLYKSGKIKSNQLVVKGYGETQLINNCKNETDCPNELHLNNRRVEWKVVKRVDDNFIKNQPLSNRIEVERFNENLNGLAKNEIKEKKSILSQPTIESVVENHEIDSEKVMPAANPDGVPLTDVIAPNDPYAEVTNATRLVAENYNDAADREAMKYEKMPTAFESTVKVKLAEPTRERASNRDIPSAYNKPTEGEKIIVPAPQFGETLVKSSNDLARTNVLPSYYTGHKIEFITSLSELSAGHEIFKRHGNISMERRPNGIFSYLIGDFKHAEVGQKFLEESMLERYPSASLVTYENGKRLGKKSIRRTKTKPVTAPPR